MFSVENPVSLENPTWEFLNSNYKKTELQKHCRDIGITKVWYTKDKLIDMILEKHRTSRTDISENNVQDHELTPRRAMKGMEELRERINIRDLDIEELNELLKAANITINKLNDRVSSLEEQISVLQRTCTAPQQTTPTPQEVTPALPLPEGSLLLGDTNLSTVRMSDLHKQCSVRTIKDANIDLINCWVSEKLQWAPNCCILYCGIQDIFDGSQSGDIFDRLGSLIASLKEVNEEMKIFICELAPVPQVQEFDEKINSFNNQLSAWSENNGVKVIKTNLQLRLGTGEVDHMCYDRSCMIEGKYLSRIGIIRLLNILVKQCPFFKLNDDWDKIMSQTLPAMFSNASQGRDTTNDNFRNNARRNREHDSHHQPTSMRSNITRQHLNVNQENSNNGYPRQRPQHGSGRYNTYDSQRPGHQNHDIPSGNREWRRNSQFNNRTHQYGNLQRYPQRTQSGVDLQSSYHQRPCNNCGELNHDLPNCRFNYRLKCGRCNEYGHKTRLCSSNI